MNQQFVSCFESSISTVGRPEKTVWEGKEVAESKEVQEVEEVGEGKEVELASG